VSRDADSAEAVALEDVAPSGARGCWIPSPETLPTFAEKAKKLIDQDQVAVVFGGWTSASRKAMLPVFEAKDHFLFYPIQYEGQE
jgi:hypothetical protein